MQNPPNNYYDHYPTVALTRPVVLNGVPTALYREVGHNLGALGGLPLIDLDHWLEHRVVAVGGSAPAGRSCRERDRPSADDQSHGNPSPASW